ncbi:MAG TPA: hypothetical protein PKA10_15270 [Selenomonadales bacterium]|nr:hypothetical protein [Selenomonadales bacterium]
MYKLGFFKDDEEREYHCSDLYTVERNSRYERMVLGLSADHIAAIIELTATLRGPFNALYVLHTPRTGNEPGRYQSKALSYDETVRLLKRFKSFFECDSRHDLWLHSPATNTTMVYDRHNLIYLYRPTNEQLGIIERKGFDRKPWNTPVPHVHHYHAACDLFEAELINEKEYEWAKSPLRDEDLQ